MSRRERVKRHGASGVRPHGTAWHLVRADRYRAVAFELFALVPIFQIIVVANPQIDWGIFTIALMVVPGAMAGALLGEARKELLLHEIFYSDTHEPRPYSPTTS